MKMISMQEFQEKFDKAMLYQKESKLDVALNLYKDLYAQLVIEATDYAKCIERPKTFDGKPKDFSPHFLKNAGEYLRSDNLASLILNNICVILAEVGNKELAKKYFKQSIKYIPGGMDYADYEIWLKD